MLTQASISNDQSDSAFDPFGWWTLMDCLIALSVVSGMPLEHP